jgi:hypothetical protein
MGYLLARQLPGIVIEVKHVCREYEVRKFTPIRRAYYPKQSEIHPFVMHFRRAHSPKQVMRIVSEYLTPGGLAPFSNGNDQEASNVEVVSAFVVFFLFHNGLDILRTGRLSTER